MTIVTKRSGKMGKLTLITNLIYLIGKSTGCAILESSKRSSPSRLKAVRDASNAV